MILDGEVYRDNEVCAVARVSSPHAVGNHLLRCFCSLIVCVDFGLQLCQQVFAVGIFLFCAAARGKFGFRHDVFRAVDWLFLSVSVGWLVVHGISFGCHVLYGHCFCLCLRVSGSFQFV